MVSTLIALTVLLPIILVLLVISAIFNCSESALTSLNFAKLNWLIKNHKNQIKNSKENKRYLKKIKRFYKFAKNYNQSLVSILIGATICSTAVATVSTLFFYSIIQNETISIWVATIVMSFIILIACEFLPKIIAKRNSERILLFFFYFLFFFNYLFFFLTKLIMLIEKRFKNSKKTFTENELLELINIIESEGIIENSEKKLIESAINFDEKTIKEVLTPVKKVIYLTDNNSWLEIKMIFLVNMFTRMPVLNKNKEVVGIINIKDFLINMVIDEKTEIKNIMHKCLFIDEKTMLNDALEKFQKHKVHLAIVNSIADNKDFVGIVSLEDILEEIVGEIYDENDESGWIHEIGRHKWIVYGSIPVKRLFKKYIHIKVKGLKDWNDTLENWVIKTKKEKNVDSDKALIFNNYQFKKINNQKKGVTFEIEELTKTHENSESVYDF